MLQQFKKFLGLESDLDYDRLVKQGAIILDVRSKGEYASGHIQGSINISMDALPANLDRIRNLNKPIITCCASGGRSARAKAILRSNNVEEVYDGGGWSQLKNKIK